MLAGCVWVFAVGGGGVTPYLQTERATLYHGDMLAVLWALAEQGLLVDGVVTDPPYSSGGLHRSDRGKDPRSKYISTGSAAASYLPQFAGDNRDQVSYQWWLSMVMAACLRVAKPSAPACVFTDWRQEGPTALAVQAGGWTFQGLQPWLKPKHKARPRMGWFWASGEFIVTATAGALEPSEEIGCLPGWIEAASPASEERLHVTEKPPEVCDWLVSVVKPGGVVLDPFAGSGAVGVAAIRSGRSCILIESEEAHCETIANRLSSGAEGASVCKGSAVQAPLFGAR